MYILVVEDDPHIQALVCSTLQADGHSVRATADGNEALAWIETMTFEAAVLDVLLPGRPVSSCVSDYGKTGTSRS